MEQTKTQTALFLRKLNIELPEPEVMEGKYYELPERYLNRCLGILIPALDSYIRSQAETQQEAFMEHIRAFPGVAKTPDVSAVPTAATTREKVKQWFLARNRGTRQNCAAELGLPIALVREIANGLLAVGELKPDNFYISRRTKDTREELLSKVSLFYKHHGGSSYRDCAMALHVSRDTVIRYTKKLKERGARSNAERSVRRTETGL